MWNENYAQACKMHAHKCNRLSHRRSSGRMKCTSSHRIASSHIDAIKSIKRKWKSSTQHTSVCTCFCLTITLVESEHFLPVNTRAFLFHIYFLGPFCNAKAAAVIESISVLSSAIACITLSLFPHLFIYAYIHTHDRSTFVQFPHRCDVGITFIVLGDKWTEYFDIEHKTWQKSSIQALIYLNWCPIGKEIVS